MLHDPPQRPDTDPERNDVNKENDNDDSLEDECTQPHGQEKPKPAWGGSGKLVTRLSLASHEIRAVTGR